MSLESRNQELRTKAEKIVDFSPQEIGKITPDEIQRLIRRQKASV